MAQNINREIKSAKVLLIDENGKNTGVVPTSEALNTAYELNLDLVEVGNKGDISVCKIIDYGKWKYEQDKKQKKSAQTSTKTITKEIKLRPNTGDNDLDYRAKHIDEFLAEDYKVKITIKFRGREQEHMMSTGKELLERFFNKITHKFNVHSNINMDGNTITVIIEAPK